MPLGLVFFLVVGFIVLGIATPSESAAFGVLGVFILAVLFKCMSWSALRKALEGTLVVTVMVLMILLASSTFSQIMAFSGASSELVEWATGFELAPIVMLLAMFTVSVSYTHLTLPTTPYV